MGPLTFRDYREAGTRRVVSSFAASLADRIEDNLPTLTSPALVVRGEHDALVPQAWAEEVTRVLPHGRLTVSPKSAHMVPFSDPSGLAQRVERFLTGITR